MMESTTEATSDKENRASFHERIRCFTEKEFELIDFAYDLAKAAHRYQLRKDGQRYFEHARATALILMDECRIMDASLIISLLLHDTIEDSPLFCDVTQTQLTWKPKAFFRLSHIFGTRVARWVITLSKPQVDGVEIRTKEEKNRIYYHALEMAAAEVKLCKGIDRLHNARSMRALGPEKQQELIRETRTYYIPLLRQATKAYPKAVAHLIEQIEAAIKPYEIAVG